MSDEAGGMPPMAQGVAAGGIFLASPDPERLIAWFNDALGIPMEGGPDGGMVLLPCGDHPTVLGVQKTREGAPAAPAGPVEREPYGRQPMMCNLRVDDLDAMVARARGAGNEVAGPEPYEGMGHFAWVRTPDGHDVELWQAA